MDLASGEMRNRIAGNSLLIIRAVLLRGVVKTLGVTRGGVDVRVDILGSVGTVLDVMVGALSVAGVTFCENCEQPTRRKTIIPRSRYLRIISSHSAFCRRPNWGYPATT